MSQYIKTEYIKLRKDFGRQPLFQAVPGHIIDSILPDKSYHKEYILRNPVHRHAQATLPQVENESNTFKIEMIRQGTNHSEGGWPRDVHFDNEDHVQRHRRRVMQDENFIRAVKNTTPTLKHCIQQNNAIEMYETYFSEMSTLKPVEMPSIRISNVFRDSTNRMVSCIKWTNEKHPKLAVSYCYKTFDAPEEVEYTDTCYIWDINRQLEPMCKLFAEYPCWSLACCPVTSEIIICGLANGTASLFDIREGIQAVSSTTIFNSHREPVTSCLYTHSRTNTEFFTGSLDGQCLWWDTRNLSEPLDQLPISIRMKTNETPNLGNSEGVTCLEFDNLLPTRFLCGTDSGLVINANRMGKSHSDILVSYWDAHDGAVRKIQRSKCTSRMFLTCGDFTVKIWSEEIRTKPIIVTKPYRYNVNDAAWAPLRYSGYMSVCSGGKFYYWDLLRNFKAPVATLQVSKHELIKIEPYVGGEAVAVGDNDGTVHLLNLSENMVIPDSRDKGLMYEIYERETRRERILDTRIKEIRLKAKEELMLDESKEVIDTINQEEEDEERAVEEAYFSIVNEEMQILGISTDNAGDN